MEFEKQIDKWQIEFKKGFAKPLILFILSEQDSYPYQLTKLIRVRTKEQIKIATTNIYPILKQLLDEGLVEKLNQEDVESRRIYYRISEKGKKFALALKIEIDEFFNDILTSDGE